MTESARRSKWWIIIGAVVALILIGLLVIPSLLDVNTYRDQIAQQLEQRLGRPVTLGHLKLRLLPSVDFAAADVAIRDDPQFARDEFITARSVRVNAALWPLLRGEIQVRAIELTEPAVTLIKEKKGRWNWSTLKPVQSTEPSATMPPIDIAAHQGQITIIDQASSPSSKHTYSGVNLELTNFSSGSMSDITLALTMPDSSRGQLEVEGTVGPIDAQDAAATALDLRLKLKDVELAGLAALIDPASSYQGRLTLEADIKRPPSGSMTIKGDGTLTQARIQVEPLKRPLTISSADLEFTGDSVRLENLRARLGSSQISGIVTIKNFDNPSATFDLTLDQLIVSEFQQVSAALHLPATEPLRHGEERGRWRDGVMERWGDGEMGSIDSPQSAIRNPRPPRPLAPSLSLVPSVHAQPARRRRSSPLRANGSLAIERVMSGEVVATDVRSTVNVANEVIELNPLQFSLYGGRYNGRARIAMGQRSPGISLAGQFDGIDVNQLISAASSMKGMIHGRGTAKLDVRASGQQFDQIVRSLNGQGTISISDGKITSFDLERQIAQLANLTGLPTGGVGTIFRNLKTAVRFVDGRVLTEDLHVELSDFNVDGSGGLRLGDPALADYALLARLGQELTKRVIPQDKAWSMIGTFFLDEQNRLVVPLKMSGPVSSPRFSLDAAVLKAHLGGTLRRQGERAVEDILKDILGGDRQKKKPN